VLAVPSLYEFYPGICLTTEGKSQKILSQGSRREWRESPSPGTHSCAVILQVTTHCLPLLRSSPLARLNTMALQTRQSTLQTRMKPNNLFLCHVSRSCYKRVTLEYYGSALGASVPSVQCYRHFTKVVPHVFFCIIGDDRLIILNRAANITTHLHLVSRVRLKVLIRHKGAVFGHKLPYWTVRKFNNL
jgi:hypothetical protein